MKTTTQTVALPQETVWLAGALRRVKRKGTHAATVIWRELVERAARAAQAVGVEFDKQKHLAQ